MFSADATFKQRQHARAATLLDSLESLKLLCNTGCLRFYVAILLIFECERSAFSMAHLWRRCDTLSVKGILQHACPSTIPPLICLRWLPRVNVIMCYIEKLHRISSRLTQKCQNARVLFWMTNQVRSKKHNTVLVKKKKKKEEEEEPARQSAMSDRLSASGQAGSILSVVPSSAWPTGRTALELPRGELSPGDAAPRHII